MTFSELLASGDRLLRGILGGAVTYTPGVGSAVVVTGVFDEAFVEVSSGEGHVATAGPAVFLSAADLPTDPTVDLAATVTINGTTYKFREVKPDGQGGVLLLLNES